MKHARNGFKALMLLGLLAALCWPVQVGSATSASPPVLGNVSPPAEFLPLLNAYNNLWQASQADPTTVSLAPNSGWSSPGTPIVFTAIYRDMQGWQHVRYVEFLLSTTASSYRAIHARYDVVQGLLFLRHPTRNRWLPSSGRPPGSTAISHICGALDVANTSAITGTHAITLTWSIKPTWRMSGKEHHIYLSATDTGGATTGWVDHGDWTVNRRPNWLIPPSLSKQSVEVGGKHWFDPKYRDLDGRDDLHETYFFIGDGLPSGPNPQGVYLRYDHQAGRMSMWDPARAAWLPSSGLEPQTTFRQETSLAILYGPGSRVNNYDAKTITTKWVIEFKRAFVGRHTLYMRAIDLHLAAGGDTGWKWKGWIEVVETIPPQIDGCDIFAVDNIWNVPVDTLPVHPGSDAFVATIGATANVHADFGSGEWPPGSGSPIGIPYVVVPGNQARVPVSFRYSDESDPGPYPIPPNPPIEGGDGSTGDRHIVILDRDNRVLYELYDAWPQPDGSWDAGSGAIFDLASYALRPDSWTSADAAGLPILPGLVRYDEVASGEIRHAIRFTAPQTKREYVWPARHFASHLTGSQYPPMGQRFRLKANYDISGYSPDCQVILRAMKKYGIMLADNGASWFISGAPDERWDNDVLHELHQVKGSAFEAVDVSSLQVHPDSAQARGQ